MKSKSCFVYVVCGDDVHIDTLHFSLRYLKHFSDSEILVVTDLSRNKIDINHDSVINVDTPTNFNNHEASIFLKTGLHKILDLESNYCYLDTDVIAIRDRVDSVFNHKYGPISFASDHCAINKFSPYAMQCGCLKEKLENQNTLEGYFKDIIPNYNSQDPELLDNVRELKHLFARVYGNPLFNIPFITESLLHKYILPGRYFDLNDKFKYDKQEKTWLDSRGRIIMYDNIKYYKEVEKRGDFKYERLTGRWLDKNGDNIYNTQCDHLVQGVKQKFDIKISKRSWRHWSGGVFLFNKDSVDFMNTWHDFTMDILKDKDWQTRDQGTLAATVWKYGLENQKRLPIEYNFIADYYDAQLSFNGKTGYKNGYSKKPVHPYFLHVYHEFGREGWDIWESILAHGPRSNQP